jgi:DNA topoisomerase-1
VKHDKSFRSIPKTGDVLTIDLAAAVELIKQPKGTRAAPTALRDLGKHPDDDALIQIFEGRFGPYVRHGDIFASLPKDRTVESVQLDEALIWLAERAALGPSKKKGRGRSGFRKKAAAPKGETTTAALKPAKKKAAKKKAAKKKTKTT